MLTRTLSLSVSQQRLLTQNFLLLLDLLSSHVHVNVPSRSATHVSFASKSQES